MELTGSQIVIECLKEQGVDTVFGYPGGTILNIYDELYRHPEIHHIRPDSATVLRDGAEVKVSPEEVSKGETIIVKPGEKIPLDGTVLTG